MKAADAESIRLYKIVIGAKEYADLRIDLDGIFKDVENADVKDRTSVMKYVGQMNGCMPAYIEKRKELYTEYFESKGVPSEIRKLVMSSAGNAELCRWYNEMQKILVDSRVAAAEIEEIRKAFLRQHPDVKASLL
jgi:hypothetical protein